jgi:transcriptional regulator with XRE-family HTH domain
MSDAKKVSDICADLGKKLKRARLAKNITQNEMARLIGSSRAKIVSAENGHATTETLAAIMIALNIEQSLSDLIPDDTRTLLEKMEALGRLRERASGNNSYAESELFHDRKMK